VVPRNQSRLINERSLQSHPGLRPENRGNLRRAIIAEAGDNEAPAGGIVSPTARIIYLQISALRVARAVRAVFCHSQRGHGFSCEGRISSTAGRRGGYAILPDFALPPVRLSAQEATACLAALALMDRLPYATHARTAADKLAACQRLSVVQCRSKRSCLSRRHRLPQPARGSMRFTSTTSWHLPTSTTQRPGSLSPTRHSKPLATGTSWVGVAPATPYEVSVSTASGRCR
jgi:hypothetical protein